MAAAARAAARTTAAAPVTSVEPDRNRAPATTTSPSALRPALTLAGGSAARAPEPPRERSWWERGASWLGEVASGALEFGEQLGWRLLDQFAPELVPIIRQGPVEWIKERLTNAVEGVFNMLAAPVRPLAGIAGTLVGHFTRLLAWIRQAAARIAEGDCGAISEAVEKIQQVFEGIAAPIVDRIKQLATRVREFFSGLWERFGAPVWQFLQRLGGRVWEQIQRFGRWIWEKAAPIRNVLARAWTWVKNKLGIGEGPEGQDGILQWLQRKAQQIWDEHIKPFIDRHRRPLMVVAGVLVMMSPAGPFIAIGAIVGGLIIGIGWIRRNLRAPNGVVNQREYLRQVIIPGILSALRRASNFLTEKAQLVANRLTQVISGLNQAVGAIAGSILNFAVRIFEWLLERFQALVAWAIEGLLRLAGWVSSTLERLRPFFQRVHDLLVQVLRVVANMMELPTMLAGRVWNAIPACIRDPFVNYFIPLILRQISFFRELVATPEAWTQTRAEVMNLVRQVFRTFDLWGAMRTAFGLLLRALNVPVELARQVWQKASQAWDAVLDRPIQFLKNMFLAVGQGFARFFRNILSHLGFGIQGWLLNSVRGMGISPPSSWTNLRDVFGFVLAVLGISLEHVLDLLATRVGRPLVNRLRTVINVLTGAWEWVRVAIEEGPGGLWRMLIDRLRNLGQMILESAIGWVMQTIIAQVSVRLTALASSAGISAIVEAFVALYRAIQTAMEYARRILAILSTVFDMVLQIARGVLGPAAELLERGLRLAMPVVIGFLANYIGLGGIGARIREIITNVRARVDQGILWLIDRALSAGRAILNMLRRGAAAIANWWNRRVAFRTEEGESHSIFVEGNPPSQRVAVESAKTYVEQLIEGITDSNKKRSAQRIRREIDRILSVSRTDTSATTQAARDLDDQLRLLAALLPVRTARLPAASYSFETRAEKAKKATVTNLSAMRPRGSSPGSTARPKGWEYAQVTGLTDSSSGPGLRRLHLINDRFGGPGSWDNLAVAGKNDNEAKHRAQVEDKIKRYVGDVPNEPDKTAVLDYEVSAVYGRSSMALSKGAVTANVRDYPSAYECKVTLKRVPDNTGDIPSGWPTRRNQTLTKRLDFDNDWEQMLIDESD